MIPPLNLNFSSASSAKSGDAYQDGSVLGSPFNVNFGNGVTQGTGASVPGWVWVAGAIAAGVWLWRRRR